MCAIRSAVNDSELVNVNQQAIDGVADQLAARIAGEVLSESVAIVPIDTGNLGRSLAAEPSGRGSWIVGTNTSYAPFVEFGTKYSPVPPGRVGKGGGQRPFLGVALEIVRRRWRL